MYRLAVAAAAVAAAVQAAALQLQETLVFAVDTAAIAATAADVALSPVCFCYCCPPAAQLSRLARLLGVTASKC